MTLSELKKIADKIYNEVGPKALRAAAADNDCFDGRLDGEQTHQFIDQVYPSGNYPDFEVEEAGDIRDLLNERLNLR